MNTTAPEASKTTRIFILIITFFLFLSAKSGFGQAGYLDGSFGDNGKAIINVDPGLTYQEAFAGTLQSDGKVLMAGYAGYASTGYAVLLRYNTDGKIDSSFALNGKALFGEHSEVYWKCIAIQTDNKIIVAGDLYYNPYSTEFIVARYNLNGSIDSSFGNNGISVTDLGLNNYCNAVVINNGKIIVGGDKNVYDSVNHQLKENLVLVRFNSDGSLDNSFGNAGAIISDPAGPFYLGDGFGDVKWLDEEKILVSAYTNIYIGNSSRTYAVLAKYNPDGSFDSSFGNNGRVIREMKSYGIARPKLLILPDNKIIVGGSQYFEYNESPNNFFLLEYKVDGSIDSSFGVNGFATTSFGSDEHWCNSIALQEDGKIIIAGGYGYSNPPTFQDFALARFNSNGIIDKGFGLSGRMTTNFSTSVTYNQKELICSALIQKDGKIMVVGSCGNDRYFAAARYYSTGTLPISLSSFSATKKEKTVLLNWQTASETNNAYFSVERSANGSTDFFAIGKVNSKGNTAQLQQYTFEDLSPLNGGNYYRLKQVDKDGRSMYSKIAFVDFAKSTTIKIYPNPVKNILQIDGLDASVKTNISIVDLSGRTLAKTSVTNSSYSWNIKQLPSGNYYLTIEAGKKITTLKFIKE